MLEATASCTPDAPRNHHASGGCAIHCVTSKHRRTLGVIFATPTLTSVVFADIEALVKALGGTVIERAGVTP